jgi:hypothetical protein
MAALINRTKKFLSLPGDEKVLFIEAYIAQLISGLVLKILPFRYIPRIFAGPEKRISATPEVTIEIKEAIQRSSLLVPWKNKCLVQSLAAKRMLNRRKFISSLSLGASLDGGVMTAHAWLISGDVEIVPKGGEFKEMFRF